MFLSHVAETSGRWVQREVLAHDNVNKRASVMKKFISIAQVSHLLC